MRNCGGQTGAKDSTAALEQKKLLLRLPKINLPRRQV
jgi:hypothetical protein